MRAHAREPENSEAEDARPDDVTVDKSKQRATDDHGALTDAYLRICMQQDRYAGTVSTSADLLQGDGPAFFSRRGQELRSHQDTIRRVYRAVQGGSGYWK